MGIFDSVFGKKDRPVIEKKELPWIQLESTSQLDEIVEKSSSKMQVIYKHSSTCGISSMVLKMFTDVYNEEAVCDLYFLTVQGYRDVSNEIVNRFGVRHESPQLLIVKNEEVTFHTSHGSIGHIDLMDHQ